LEVYVFFAPPRAEFPKAGQAAHLRGQALDPTARLSLLAGVEIGAARRGNIVCACFSLGEAASRGVNRKGKPTGAAEIGAARKAGTRRSLGGGAT
jgi:hypothetical protein